MSDLIKQHRTTDPPKWLQKVKSAFTGNKGGSLTGSRKLGFFAQRKADKQAAAWALDNPEEVSRDEELGINPESKGKGHVGN